MDEIVVCPECDHKNLVDNDFQFLCENCGYKFEINKNFYFKFFSCIIFFVLLIIYLNKKFYQLGLGDDFFELVYTGIIVIFISYLLSCGKFFKNLKYLLAWGAIFLFCLILYSYKYELSQIKDRVVSEIIPGSSYNEKAHSISFKRKNDGHFYINSKVNSSDILFLVDTGATSVVLSKKDGRKLGLLNKSLKFNKVFYTANGKVRAGEIKLDKLMIGNFIFKDVRAYINDSEMENSLLGISLLKKFKKFEIKDDILTLYI